MTYELSISREKKLVYITLEGPYSIDLLKNLIQKVITDKQYKVTDNILINLQKITFNPSINDVSVFSDSIVTLKEHFQGKVARVTKSDVIYNFYEQTAIFESKAGVTSKVFHDIRDAFIWLSSY